MKKQNTYLRLCNHLGGSNKVDSQMIVCRLADVFDGGNVEGDDVPIYRQKNGFCIDVHENLDRKVKLIEKNGIKGTKRRAKR